VFVVRTAAELLEELHTKGIRLQVQGEHILVDAPKHALTDELRAAIRQGKTALLTLLTASAPAAVSSTGPLTQGYPCVVCRQISRWNDHGVWRCGVCWPPARMEQAARRIGGIEA